MAPHPFDLSGKRALVTGATGGLGLAIAHGLADAGAAMLLHGRDRLRAKAAAEGWATPLAADLADEAATAAMLEAAGRIDILVNNAGARDRRPLDALDREAVRAMLEVNLVAPFDLARRASAAMGKGGRIVNVTSIAGPIARAGDAAYTASKAALDGLTRALAAELGPRGITVNAVAPGYFATEANQAMTDDAEVAAHLARRTSLGRWGDLGEIAGAVVFLSSPAASYVTGQVLAVDGGYLAHF